MPENLGNCAMYITAKNLMDKTEDQFIKRLSRNYPRVTQSELSDGQVDAWRNCFHVLCDAFRSLPGAYGDLWVVFEYVLPNHAPGTRKFSEETHIRSDVILVAGDAEVVLEFKRSGQPFDGYYHQAMKYRKRLRKFHEQSFGMRVEAALVMTKAKNFRGCFEDVPSCSPDQLPAVLEDAFGEIPGRCRDIRRWLDSAFVRSELLDGGTAARPGD